MREKKISFGPQEPLTSTPKITVGRSEVVLDEPGLHGSATAHGHIRRGRRNSAEKITSSSKTPTGALYVIGVVGGVPELRRGAFAPQLDPARTEKASEYVD